MKKSKLTKKKKILLLTVLTLFFVFLICNPVSLARYVYQGIKNYYFETKSFYFNCDKMDNPRAIYQIDNWAGVNSFDVTFNMNSLKNNSVSSTSDIYYDITYSCSSNVTCTITKNNGVIFANNNRDYFVVTITPNVQLNEGDSVWLLVSATSTSPYVETISGRVTLNVGIPGLTYEIVDVANQPYLNFNVTNTLDFYKVITPFNTYSVGDTIENNAYLALNDTDKRKCASAVIRLDFDPQSVLLDLTSEIYQEAISYTSTTLNGYSYVNSITFGMDAISSKIVRFYKADAARNYTYPYVNNTSIVDFNVL